MIHGATIAAPDFVWPEDDATTVYEWRRGWRSLQVFVGTGCVEFLQSWGPNVHTQMRGGATPQDLPGLVGWVLGERGAGE